MAHARSGKEPGGDARGGRSVVARLAAGEGGNTEASFATTFTVGAGERCQLRVTVPGVAAAHLQVVFDGRLWWLRDLHSEAGTWVDGQRIQFAALGGHTEVRLGREGPRLALALAAAAGDSPPPTRGGGAQPAGARRDPRPRPAADLTSEADVIRRYFDASSTAPAGRETLLFRRAYRQVRRRASRRYHLAIAAALLALVAAAGVVAHQRRQLAALRASAERIYYATRTLELQTARLEEAIRATAGEAQAAEVAASRAQVQEMERQYDGFVQQLRVYDRAPADERAMLRIARLFGECDVDVPREFVAEVRRYAQQWRATERLDRALQRASRSGYAPVITAAFTRAGLPPQYLLLAMQESGFDERAVGPATRYGYAKGMWQFIGRTARRYGLRVGPLEERAEYDPADERFDWRRSTTAAVRYIKDLQLTDAQGSGLLVMASYNWGEDHVRDFIRSLPPDPEHRNFWRLLVERKVPPETYDYVLAIFSAAALCDDPSAFGAELACPFPGAAAAANRAPR